MNVGATTTVAETAMVARATMTLSGMASVTTIVAEMVAAARATMT